jgi:hypothetical protein
MPYAPRNLFKGGKRQAWVRVVDLASVIRNIVMECIGLCGIANDREKVLGGFLFVDTKMNYLGMIVAKFSDGSSLR